MSQDPQDREVPGGDENLLVALDSDLNIFALANGMDLHRNRGSTPDRVFEWFHDGLDRFIHVDPAGPDALAISVSAEGQVDGVRCRTRVVAEPSVSPDDLRAHLARTIEIANALGREALRPL